MTDRTQTSDSENTQTSNEPGIEPKRASRPSKRKSNSPEYNEDDLRIAELMFTKLIVINPNHKTPNLERWANAIRLIRERDGKSPEEIESLFIWANGNNFWSGNILSPDALRKHWDKLSIQRGKNKSCIVDRASNLPWHQRGKVV